MKTSHLLPVFTTAALCLVACAPPEGPRELPAPRLDLSRIFPQADATSAHGSDLTTSEARFRQLAAAPDPSPAAHSRIRIPLGASLSGELPHSPDWSWSQRTGLTLIAHQSAAPHPDILILAQPYAPARAQRPSQALHNFIAELLPGASPLSLTSIAGDLPQLATELQSLQTSLTGGRGLGFTPSLDTFSGWRTIGQNASGTHIRLAHYEGTWTSQPNLPVGLSPQSISSLSSQLAKNLPAGLIPEDRLNESLNMLESLSTPSQSAAGSTPQARRPPESARLIVSTIEASPSHGLHLALLCSGTTSCPQAPHVARFLESISSDVVPTSAPTLSLSEHSQQLQITLP